MPHEQMDIEGMPAASEDPPEVAAERPPEEELGPVLLFMRVLWGLDHALHTTSKQMESRLGITGRQRLVVRLVGRFPGISAGGLAEIQRVHPGTLTGVLRRLEERGILSRRKDPRDARRALLWLTPEGLHLNEVRVGTVEAAVGHALARVSPDALAGAHQTLAALKECLDQQDRPAGPLEIPVPPKKRANGLNSSPPGATVLAEALSRWRAKQSGRFDPKRCPSWVVCQTFRGSGLPCGCRHNWRCTCADWRTSCWSTSSPARR